MISPINKLLISKYILTVVRHLKCFSAESFNKKKSGKEKLVLLPDCGYKKEEGIRLILSQGTSKAGVRDKRATEKFTGGNESDEEDN